MYLGDFAEDATLDFKWSTNDAAGASITRATDGTVSVYVGNSTTQLTTGVTDTEDFDSLTGVHHCRIDLSSSATYAPGSECQVVLSAATIDGETVNAVLAHFSIERAGGALALLKGANGLAALKAETAAIVADTNELQTDDTPGALAALDAKLDTIDDFLDTEVAAILADTNELQTDWANGGRLDLILDARASQTSVDTVDSNVDAILADTGTDGVVVASLATQAKADVNAEVDTALADYDAPTKAELDSGLGALNDLSAAEVNAEVVDALATDTYAEPGQGAPAATATLAAKLGWLFAAWRNAKDNDGTTTNLYADDGSTIIAKQSTSEDGGTVTKGEWITGA